MPLSWSHIIELLPLKTIEEKLYYAEEVMKQMIEIKETEINVDQNAVL